MAITDLIKAAGNALEKSDQTTKLGVDLFKKDAEFLEEIKELKTPELTNKITEHLVENGKPGSAEYMGLYSKSAVLDKEAGLIEAGALDLQKIESAGLPLMIDIQQTTPEMIANNQAVLTTEARTDFLGATNSLKYKLDTHIDKTAQKASEYYANELTKENSFSEKMQGILGTKTEPYDIPFTPNETEMAKLEELSTRSYLSRDEAQREFQKELNSMMKARPGSIGLTTTASTSKFVGEMAQELGGKMEGPVDITKLRDLHTLMRGQGMDELQINPEFGKTLENGVDRDFIGTKTPETTARADVINPKEVWEDTPAETAALPKEEVINPKDTWIEEDIKDETKEWLNSSENTDVASEFSTSEQETARKFSEKMTAEAEQRSGKQPEGEMDSVEALKAVAEDEDDSETMRLLLRIAIKVGTKVAVSVAKNIAKDKDTPQELRIALGVFSDLADDGSKFADKLITGEDKPNLERDCVNFVRSKFASAES